MATNPTLYAVVDPTENVLLSVNGPCMRSTIPVESDITLASERLAKLQKGEKNKLAIAKVTIKVEEIL